MANVHEELARQRKVTALLSALTGCGVTADDTASLSDPAVRRAAERAAGVRECSDTTWGLVVEALERAARVALHVPADPFACFDGAR